MHVICIHHTRPVPAVPRSRHLRISPCYKLSPLVLTFACLLHILAVCSERTLTGGGQGGPLSVVKSLADISSAGRSASPGSKSGSSVDLPALEVSAGSISGASNSSGSSRPQGQDAIMSASGFVHAKGEQVHSLSTCWKHPHMFVHLVDIEQPAG